MPFELKISAMQGIPKDGKLNEEWIEIVNQGDAPFNGEGCSISVASSPASKRRVITTLKAGLIVKPSERVRLVTGSSGKKSHGEPPNDEVRNFHLFLKMRYLNRPGLVVRLEHRAREICRGSYSPSEEAPAASSSDTSAEG